MTVPKCPYFRKCGGCTSQHIPYDLQLENKKKSLSYAVFSRYEEEQKRSIKVFSGKEYYYRNRMDFVFFDKGIGFRQMDRWDKIIDIKECLIANQEINRLLTEVRESFIGVDAFDVRSQTGTFRYAVIRTPKDDSSISFTINSRSSRINEAVEKIKRFAETTKADNILVTYADPDTETSISEDFFVVKGSEKLHDSFLGKEFAYHVQGFFQNNPEIAEKMHEYVNDLLKQHETRQAQLLDLYAGVGTFGIINADLFKKVAIVEEFAGSIDLAKENIKANEVMNAEAIVLDAKQIKRLALGKPLFVITDPPRSGMHANTIAELNRLQPETIIYISCNQKQLSKDLPKFRNYRIKSTALFDLFPQTNHSEAVIELVKN